MDKQFIQYMLDISISNFKGAKAFGLDCAEKFELEVLKWELLLEAKA